MSQPRTMTEHVTPEHPPTHILDDVYCRLFAEYGPQHWWPAETPFEVMVGAILTQSTSWANVEKAIGNLKATGLLSPAAIRDLGIDELASLIRPSGYYSAKARKLKALVTWLGEHGDDLSKAFSQDTAALRQELLSIYGVGEETADSIILYAAGRPVFVIDAYTRRIVDRIGITPPERTYRGYQDMFVSRLPPDAAMFNEYHALLVQHGKSVCRRQPRCQACCLLELCKAGLRLQPED